MKATSLALAQTAQAHAAPQRVAQPRSEAVIEKILTGGIEVFLEHGFAGTSIDVIAKLTRTSKATIYRYFPNKEVLFTAIVDRVIEERRQPVQVDASQHAEVRSVLIDFAEQMIERCVSPRRLRLCRVYMFEIQKFPVIENLFARFDDRDGDSFVVNFVDVIGGRLKSFTDAKRAASTFLYLVVHPFMYWALFRPQSFDAAPASDRRRDVEAFVDQYLAIYPPA